MSSTPNPNPENGNPPAPTAADLDRLKAALEAERAAHKETKTKAAERRTVYARTLGLAENVNDEDIVAHLSGTDHAKAVASIQAERDELRAKVTKIEQERDAQHVESAISAALSKSGMIPANHEDAANLIRSMLTVKEGKVVTKDGVPNVIPGMDPTQLFHATVKTLRPHWWPSSVGGGAVGSRGNANPNALPGDASCFDPRSPNFNVTKQGQYHRAYGPEVAARARAQYGGGR
jgi:hypothetical protein